MDNIDTNINMDVNSEEINNLGKEERLRIIRKHMAKLLEDDTNGTFKDVFDSVTKVIDNYESIDQNMITRLNDIFSNDLIKKEKFADIVKAIGQGSTVVYFKSAQLFKVYKKSELESLLGGQLRTIYKQLHDSYEVVSNDSKQKIIILGDVSLSDNIESIKTYIAQFMISEGITTFTHNDIVCYKGKDSIEIIINDYYVENQTEHDEIVKKLLNYIFQQEKNTKIVQKINTSSYSEFEGVKMVSMPSDKQLLATKYIEPLLTMISNVHQCSGYRSHITLNVTNIINDNSDNSVNTTNDHSVNNSINVTSLDPIKQFIDHIKNTKPVWYKSGKWIFIKDMFDHFKETTDSDMTINKFSREAFNKLYVKKENRYINKNQGRAILLIKFQDL